MQLSCAFFFHIYFHILVFNFILTIKKKIESYFQVLERKPVYNNNNNNNNNNATTNGHHQQQRQQQQQRL